METPVITAIRKALDKHRLAVKESGRGIFSREIENTVSLYQDFLHSGHSETTGSVEMRSEIRRLRRLLNSLQVSTRHALDQCSWETRTYKELESADAPLTMLMVAANCKTPFRIALDLLIESCEVALKTGGSFPFQRLRKTQAPQWEAMQAAIPDLKKINSAVEMFATRRGRPINVGEVIVVSQLARIFHSATSRMPTDSPAGPFEDFVAAFMSTVNPESTRSSFRRIVRRALAVYRARLKERDRLRTESRHTRRRREIRQP
jgi:hypothetical protein